MNCKNISLLFIVGLSSALIHAAAPAPATVCGSHVYVPRGASTDLTWIDALTFYNRTRKYPNKPYLYSSATIYQNGRKSSKLGSAFLLGDGSNSISVQQTPVIGVGAIPSVQLGLGNAAPAAPFAGTLSIRPSNKQFSYIGNLYCNLDSWWCGTWADLTFGVTNVHHQLNCCQTGNISTLCPGITSIGSALGDASNIQFTKFYCGLCRDGKRRTGFEDLQMRLGYDYFWCADNRLGVYGIGTLPAGRRPTNEYIFEPLVGSKHASIGIGMLGDYQVWDCDGSALTVMTDINYRYVLRHTECRTFDLLPAGPFSRYLLLVDNTAPGFPFPAANATTANVRITPRSTIQWWLGLNFEYCNYDFELGYNLFWRQKEQLKQTCVPLISSTLGFYNLNGSGIAGVTATGVTATSTGTSSPVFVPLSSADIDVNSGLAGRLLTNKFYGAFSFTGCACDCFEWMTGLGASYEYVSKHDRCNGLQNWAVFGKFAIGF